MKATTEELKIAEETLQKCMVSFMASAAQWQETFLYALRQTNLANSIPNMEEFARQAFMHNMMTFFNEDITMDGIVDQAKDILNPDK